MAEGESAARDIHILRAGGGGCSQACEHETQHRNGEKMRKGKQEGLSTYKWELNAGGTGLAHETPAFPYPAPTWIQGQQAKESHQWVHGVHLEAERGREPAEGKGHLTSRNPELAQQLLYLLPEKEN